MIKKLFLIALLLSLVGCTRIGPGHAGIEVNAAGSDKGVASQTATTGWFIYNPISTTVIEYQTAQRIQKWTKDPNEGEKGNQEVSFTNKDQMVINADVAIAYSLDPNKVPAFYVKFLAKDEDDLENKFTNGYLKNQVRNCLNDNAGQYEIKEIMGDNAKFLKDTKDCIQNDVAQWGVHIDQFGLIGAPRPPQQVIDTINEKAKAEQLAIQKQIELEQVKADAAKKIAESEGEAKSLIAQAHGDAVYKTTIAQAEADANAKLTGSITPVLLEWQKLKVQSKAVDKWDGVRPQVEGNSGGLLLQLSPQERQHPQQ